jgi:crotonobetainyl-CoA:carnitine CoA-transferase CaiB-like acyl-CoA transferase
VVAVRTDSSRRTPRPRALLPSALLLLLLLLLLLCLLLPARAYCCLLADGAFETAEGRKVLISIQNEREWRSLCAVLERPLMAAHVDYCTAVARVANRPRLDAAISALFEQWEHDALVAALFEGGVAYGSVNPLDAVLEHPQLRTTEYALPGGAKSVQVVAHPVVDALAEAAGVRDGDHRPVPAIGEHTEALRQEFA